MRFGFLLAAALLTGCAVPVSQTAPSAPASQQSARVSQADRNFARQAVANYLRVGKRIEAVAEPVCRRENPQRPRSYCDFQIKVDTSDTTSPNAFQTIGPDGRPILAFNIPMLATVQNDDEIAFILGHEAGHQISSHIVKQNTNANLGAILLGGIFAASGASQSSVATAQNLGGQIGARAYSKSHELEADVIGTYIADLAGYNPSVGAQSFSRFASSDSLLSTHPPSAQRLATVRATVRQIAAAEAAGRPFPLP